MQFLEKLWKIWENIEILNFEILSRRNYLVTESNYHITKFFTEYLLAKGTKKTEIIMNKPVYLGLAILELSKILIYEIWYDYVKLKCGEKSKWCYIDTEIFIVYIKQMILQKMLKLD